MKWRTLVEFTRAYLSLTLEHVDKYLFVCADDFSDWKECAIYEASGSIEEVERVVREIERLVYEADRNPMYCPTTDIANLVDEITGEFIVGEIAPEMGVCGEEDYIAYPNEDESLSWPLCVNRERIGDVRKLLREGLIPSEWVRHLKGIV